MLNGNVYQDKVKLRLEDSTRGASGPTAEPQEGGASDDMTLLRTGRLVIYARTLVTIFSTVLCTLQVHQSYLEWPK